MAQSRGTVWQVAALMVGQAVASPSDLPQRMIIPFEMNRLDHMVVELQINDQISTTGVIDTAATFAMVDARAAQRSGVAVPDAAAPMINILGVNGDADYPVVRLDSVRLGNLSLHAMDAAYSTGLDVPGAAANILPSSAFPGDVLEFDFDTRTISAYDGKPDVAPGRVAKSLSYEIENGLIFVDIRINGKRGRALIDTGSSLSYVNSTFARLASMRRNDEMTSLLFGATGDTEKAWVASVRTMRLADFRIEQPNLLVSDPFLLERLGLKDEPVMILGLDFLSRFRIQFHRPKQQLILSIPKDPERGTFLQLYAPATRMDSTR